MKFLLCLVLCLAAAQASLIGVPKSLSYTTYSGVPSLYNGLAYSRYASYPYSAAILPSTVYDSRFGNFDGSFLPSTYIAPSVYSRPSFYSTLLKK